jgi:polyhydroxybutyrate depolymerase
MRARKVLARAGAALVALPVVLLLVAWASISILDRSNGTLVSSGEEREYLLHVPRSYDPAKPTPLVISMHGAAVWPAHQMNTSRWNRLADEHGFIVVYPSGSDLPKIWHVNQGSGLMRDVRFISELIDTLAVAYNLDLTRVYANGLSNGGGMAFVLSCALPDRIAAVGLVAAAQSLPWSWCTDSQPVPMIAFHGTADPIVAYEGGRSPVAPEPFPSVAGWTSNWAVRNRCATRPADSVIAADVTRRTYTGCAADAAVVLYTVHGGGHSWPGGKPLPKWMVGPTSDGVDATSQMWAFFRAHPLRGARAAARRD